MSLLCSTFITCPGCENGLDSDNMHRDDMGEYYDDCYMNMPEEEELFKPKQVTINSADYCDCIEPCICHPNKWTNNYNNCRNEYDSKNIDKFIDRVIENVDTRIVNLKDSLDKPDIDYIRGLLEHFNYNISMCVMTIEQEEIEFKQQQQYNYAEKLQTLFKNQYLYSPKNLLNEYLKLKNFDEYTDLLWNNNYRDIDYLENECPTQTEVFNLLYKPHSKNKSLEKIQELNIETLDKLIEKLKNEKNEKNEKKQIQSLCIDDLIGTWG